MKEFTLRSLRGRLLASLGAASLAFSSVACGQSTTTQQSTGGCPSGQVHCASCGGAGFCGPACPAYACPAGDGGGIGDSGGAPDAGLCPASSPTSCTDCGGSAFCVAGACPAISCPDDGGSAGDGGGVSADGGNPAACPTTPPGGSCSQEGLSCGYHCLGCTCTGGQWNCPGLGCAGGFYACPASPPGEGSACVTDGCCGSNFTPCWYGGVNGQNVRADCNSGAWHLTSPVADAPDAGGSACGTPGCPAAPPFTSGAGGTCTQPITCEYGIGGSCSCNGSAWTCNGASFDVCPQTLPSAGSTCGYPSQGTLGTTYGRCAYGSKVCGCTAGGWVCC